MTSKDYARIAAQSLSLIGDLRRAEKTLDTLANESKELVTQKPDEGTVAFLGRLASAAHEARYDAMKKETLEQVAKAIDPKTPASSIHQPTTRMGRMLSNLAHVVG